MNIWNTSIEVEHNPDNWNGAPKFFEATISDARGDLIHIDLFSGCGGFSTGFEISGFQTTLALDHHPPSLATLLLNHNHSSGILGDIRGVSLGMIKDSLPKQFQHSIVTAGVPCQGFSLSNRKRHADDDRNFLFKEFIRISKDLAPDAVVLENVSGLVSTRDGEFRDAISSAISELGFDVHMAMLNAADYGVPQNRRRVFFVGVPKGSDWLFPEPNFGTSTKPHRSVKDAILGDLPRLSSNQEIREYSAEPQNEYQSLLRRNNPPLTNHKAPNHPQETIDRIRQTKPGEPMYASFKQRIRLHTDLPSPTQVCGGIRPQFQFGHPTQARGLTIRERARLQSFPDSYKFTGGLTQGRVQTGNAVPPLLAAAIADQIRKLLSGEKLQGHHLNGDELRLF